MADETLDAKGLNCPMPIIKARKILKGMEAGQTLDIEATDPGAVKDFDAFCEMTGHVLLHSGQDGDVYNFTIRRA